MLHTSSQLPLKATKIECGLTSFATGLHLLAGGPGSGKSILALALSQAAESEIYYCYVNEPHGEYLSNEDLIKRIKADRKPQILVVDSLTLFMLTAGASPGAAAMKGGLTAGHIAALTSIDYFAAVSHKVVIATLNTTAFPIQVDDAVVTGMMSPNVKAKTLHARDRIVRDWRCIQFSPEQVATAAASLGYETFVQPSAEAERLNQQQPEFGHAGGW